MNDTLIIIIATMFALYAVGAAFAFIRMTINNEREWEDIQRRYK